MPPLSKGDPHSESGPTSMLERLLADVRPDLIRRYRHLHRHPELSNREFATAAYLAEELRGMGIPVRTGVARTGVVGLIEGVHPGPVLALRADMDGLPVAEASGLDFASTATAEYEGNVVSVSHACGHDAHMAMLLVAAGILVRLRDRLKGAVKLLFQPAEEGPPDGEPGGAPLMIAEGVLENPAVHGAFGLHVMPSMQSGVIGLCAGPIMAAADGFTITLRGRQTHGSMPWTGVDPVSVAAHVVLGLHTLIAREADLTRGAAVLTVGMVRAGVRRNIIPCQAMLCGTLRTLDPELRSLLMRRIVEMTGKLAAAHNAEADVLFDAATPMTVNHRELTEALRSALSQAAGAPGLEEVRPVTGAEDFGCFAERVPSLYAFLGCAPTDGRPFGLNHAPDFRIDENALLTGVRAHVLVALRFASVFRNMSATGRVSHSGR